MVRHLLHEVVILGGEAVALAGYRRLHTAGLLADFLHPRCGLGDAIVAVRCVHGLHVLGDDLVLTLLAVQDGAVVGAAWGQSIRLLPARVVVAGLLVEGVLVSCGSLSCLLDCDRVDGAAAGWILAIKAIVILLLMILRRRPRRNAHIVQADLALMALATCVGLDDVVVLRARQVLRLLLVQLLRVALVGVRACGTRVLSLGDSTVAAHLPVGVVIVEVGVELNGLVH